MAWKANTDWGLMLEGLEYVARGKIYELSAHESGLAQDATEAAAEYQNELNLAAGYALDSLL